MAYVGPMFGQVGYFYKFAGREIDDKRPLERYRDEAKRILTVLDRRLAGREWIMDTEYTIADVATLGWVRNLIGYYGARDLVGFRRLKHVPAWLIVDFSARRCSEGPKSRGGSAPRERKSRTRKQKIETPFVVRETRH